MATNPKKILNGVKLNKTQFNTIVGGGSVTSGSDTYTADLNTLYLTPDTSVSFESQTLTDAEKAQARNNVAAAPSVLTGSTAPTTSTVGEVGQFYLETTTPKLYQCTSITSGTPDTYTWTEVGGGGGGVQQDTSVTQGANLYTKLNDLVTNGKTILSISFTPTDNNVSISTNKLYYDYSANSPAYSYSTPSMPIFIKNKSYNLKLVRIDDLGFHFLGSITNQGSSIGPVIDIKIGSSENKANFTHIGLDNAAYIMLRASATFTLPDITYTISYL